MRRLPLAILLAAAGTAALAQYKVVGPDGKVTYTDRPPADATLRVTPLGPGGAADAPAASPLPPELQKTAQRFPVMLYASPECTPCDAGRQLLKQRGVPYTERIVGTTADDAAALERATGARTVPAVTIGAQALSGFEPVQWGSYLDAAGYPRESRLPKGWAAPAATPLVERKAVTAAAPTAPPGAASAPGPQSQPKPASSIRF
ncbi:MAG TPA: glutaredoxin family protein [Rubrivivax sp.]|nr:glutaredoxin family protein [Rubrivivax sp.]HRZ60800.1 glutaredoxin family protein [Rubrivivax sp.]